ncbi:unnamed protein product [Penicillium nalgiovense]|uniref:Uncharacterized protein n=2 Tax=Penicillium nalgiovense TaxID=60175 RepID=A0A9W4HIH7_PENNA|nr:unnamed protein product [Penicillium nalgiovense]CAG7996300.1 unnamed protein product [Penicillium nalgiovense]CAG8027201.1 unnamed protein product [Penicillium nalgiovense]CAG8029940.1 unnamed protein product [Penicillium nalgiovense]CAG8045670.1 unnamed protein product [Penicillium nalgiovense]
MVSRVTSCSLAPKRHSPQTIIRSHETVFNNAQYNLHLRTFINPKPFIYTHHISIFISIYIPHRLLSFLLKAILQISSSTTEHSSVGIMGHHTMPVPRIPGLSLPSFRELDESVEANRPNQPSPHVSNNMYDGIGNRSSYSPQEINTIPNPYPPYPAKGWLIPPDPSQNVCIHPSLPRDIILISSQAFRESGFTYQDVSAGILQPNVSVDREHHLAPELIQLPPLAIRPKETETLQTSPTPTQSTISSAPTARRETLSPSTQVPSTPEKISSNAPRPIPTNQVPPNKQINRQRINRDAAANHRVQRRRVGVHFSEVAAHTAKCDVCNKRNKNGMSRCQNCGWQVCRKCLTDRNGDRTHASFGATHVPEGGGDMPVSSPPVDGTQDCGYSKSIAEVRAAQTLLDLGSFSNGTGTGIPTTTGEVKGAAGGQKVPPARRRVLRQQGDALSTDSDTTLSVVEDEEWARDESDIPIGEDGLPIGYVITRRNPARAARPSTKMAE